MGMAKTAPQKLPIQYRFFEIDPSQFKDRAAEADSRTVELSFSSETEEVERWGDIEILDHKKNSVRLSRLKNAAPLLLNHSSDKQIGVVESASLKEKRGVAMVRFGNSPLANEIYQDVKDGIRRNVSVGYRIHAMQREKREGEKETWRVTDWEPLEISIVAVPADSSVGVGRSVDATEYPVKVDAENEDVKNTRTFNEPDKGDNPPGAAPHQVNVEKERTDATNRERARFAEIDSITDKFPQVRELAVIAKRDGLGADEFRRQAFEALATDARKVTERPEIGMSEKDLAKFSIVRAVRGLANGKLDGFEKECSDQVAKNLKREAAGFFIPFDVTSARALGLNKRELNASVGSEGAYTVGTNLLGGSMIELLRNRQLISQMGAMTLGGLIGNVAIPKVAGGATAYWLGESEDATASQQAFAQLGLTPHRLAAITAYTKQLLAQSSIDVEAFVRNDLMTVLAIEKDRVAIDGDGANGEPLGIMNTSGKSTGVTFSGAATRAKAIEFQANVAANNASRGALAYLTTPAAAAKWMAIDEATGAASWLWKGSIDSGIVVGRRAESTNQVPGNKVIYGNFNDLVLADWDGIDVVVDPYTLAASNQIRLVINLMTDVGLRHPKSFSVSSDTGAA
jgi:HK97 family phage major capsid protein/HK97 family phage prohead protease